MLTYVEFSQFKLEKCSIPIRLTLLDRNSMFVVSNFFQGIQYILFCTVFHRSVFCPSFPKIFIYIGIGLVKCSLSSHLFNGMQVLICCDSILWCVALIRYKFPIIRMNSAYCYLYAILLLQVSSRLNVLLKGTKSRKFY